MAVDGHAGSLAVENLEALGHIGHADAVAAQSARPLQQVRGSHADAVVFHLDDQLGVGETAAQVDAAAFDLRGQAVLDGILHQRLQQHAGHHDVERSGIQFLPHPQLVAPEANHFDIEIVVDELHFLAQRDKGVTAVQQAAQDVRQFDDHDARGVRIEAHQRRHRVQGVEQEVRIDLVLQRFHAGVQQHALLLFQLDLNADAVPDLEFNANDGHRAGIDQDAPPTRWSFPG